MRITIKHIILLCLLGFGTYALIRFSSDDSAPGETILQVHVAFRHGDRVVDETESYPNDPNRKINFYPLSIGQLTNNGKKKAYRLGQMLRKRYNNFLGEYYDSEIVQTISTNYDRTKMSAELVLAGLFPPLNVQQWDSNLMWQPIPVAYITQEEDTWFDRPITYCPVYRDEYLKVADNVSQKVLDENVDLIEYIFQNSGRRLKTVHSIYQMQQTQYVEEQMNLTLPDWVRKIYPEPLSALAAKQVENESYNQLLKRLNGGNFLRRILGEILPKINGTLTPAGRKIYLYSGHETTAANMLIALNVWDNLTPLFSSATIIELVYRSLTQQYGLKIYYHDQRSENPKLLTIPGCAESFCEINKFLEVTEAIIPKNYTAECKAKTDIHTFPKY